MSHRNLGPGNLFELIKSSTFQASQGVIGQILINVSVMPLCRVCCFSDSLDSVCNKNMKPSRFIANVAQDYLCICPKIFLFNLEFQLILQQTADC